MSATAFIALLPSDILITVPTPVAPVKVALGRHDVILYWPFWHEASAGRVLPPIRSAAIPSRSSAPFYRVPPFDLTIEATPPAGHSFANGLRLDVLDSTDDDFVTGVAAALLQQFRVRTNQWWIGHSHREGESLVRASYSIDDHGSLIGQDCSAGAVVEPRLQIERPLTPAMFSAACASIASGSEVPAHWDLFFDAVYFSIHRQDWRRALLDACIACDLAVVYDAIRAGQAVGKPELAVRHALSDRDLLKNLREGLPNLFGPAADYSQNHTSDYDLIRRLWSARGSIAHGHVPTTGTFGRAFVPSRSEAADLILAAMRLLDWLKNLPHAVPPPSAA